MRKKIEIVIGIGLIAILFMSYQYFRSSAVAQTSPDNDVLTLQSNIQVFFEILGTQTSSSDACQRAYQRLFYGMQQPDIDIQIIAQKTEEMIKDGTRWRPEYLDAKNVGTDLIQMRYFYKSDTHPVIWYFTYYRTPASSRNWNCISVRFDTNIDPLFKESWPK
ncbi:MAG: hypothetical protein FWD31_04150 [Planctomycetaceae bacterium]|nr:hypothetical protein [Planctomycetaceae bacterium]